MSIHCPDCSNKSLAVLKQVKKNHDRLYTENDEFYRKDVLVVKTTIKSDEIIVYCDKCKHWHIMKSRNFTGINPRSTQVPRKVKIKGYGVYHYN